jgi:hypothetical protein
MKQFRGRIFGRIFQLPEISIQKFLFRPKLLETTFCGQNCLQNRPQVREVNKVKVARAVSLICILPTLLFVIVFATENVDSWCPLHPFRPSICFSPKFGQI